MLAWVLLKNKNSISEIFTLLHPASIIFFPSNWNMSVPFISIKMYHLWVFLVDGSASGWELWGPRGHRFEPVGGWSRCRRHLIPSEFAFFRFLQEDSRVCCYLPPRPAKIETRHAMTFSRIISDSILIGQSMFSHASHYAFLLWSIFPALLPL